DVYRKFSRVETIDHLEELIGELRDRFGPIPAPAQNLVELKRLQLLAQKWQIDDIHLEANFVVFGYRNPKRIGELAALSGDRLRIVDGRSAYLVSPQGETAEIDLL